MQGRIVQVSVSPGGIPERAVPEAHAGRLGLEGDAHAHPNVHGGPMQALLLVSAEMLDQLRADGWPLFPGALGENLTTSSLDFRQVRIGQRFAAGDATIEISKVRQPCHQLSPYGAGIQNAVFDAACKRNDPASPRWGLAGFYARVEKAGLIPAGAPIRLVDQAV
jgi:MOSC domain-containing protein YiiM